MSTLAYDGTAMLGRQLRRVRNNPGLLVLTQTMPITMLLFFGYVFGSALAMPGEQYRSFLVPGLLVATAANGIMTGMFQVAQDVHRGVTDRLRTLPISRAAVPLGQSVADVLVTAAGMVPFLLVGLAVGWRVEGSAPQAVGAVRRSRHRRTHSRSRPASTSSVTWSNAVWWARCASRCSRSPAARALRTRSTARRCARVRIQDSALPRRGSNRAADRQVSNSTSCDTSSDCAGSRTTRRTSPNTGPATSP